MDPRPADLIWVMPAEGEVQELPPLEALFFWLSTIGCQPSGANHRVPTMKRAIVFANGELPDPAAIRPLLQPDDWIVAVDGGVRHALACGRAPQLVIGDLDSFPANLRAELEAGGTEFLTYPVAKDETDLELALLHVAASGATAVVIVGALGDRLDHTLTNVQLLARKELLPLEVRMVDGPQTACLVWSEATIRGAAGDRVSLIPLGGDAKGVSTRGLAWPLRDEALRFGEGRGVSNVMTGPTAHIQLTAGRLLCVHYRSTDRRASR